MTDGDYGSGQPPEISVVLMAFNENATLAKVMTAVLDVLASMSATHEVIVIDDGSTDGTRETAARMAEHEPSCSVVVHRANLGLGEVYRSGFMVAKGQYLTFLPADGQFPPENIPVLYKAARGRDAAFGFMEQRRDGGLAASLSAIERLMCRALLGPMPRFQGIFMLRRDILPELKLRSDGRGWGILMELAAKVHQGDYEASSVRTTVVPRISGVSKVRNVQTVIANARELLTLGLMRIRA